MISMQPAPLELPSSTTPVCGDQQIKMCVEGMCMVIQELPISICGDQNVCGRYVHGYTGASYINLW